MAGNRCGARRTLAGRPDRETRRVHAGSRSRPVLRGERPPADRGVRPGSTRSGTDTRGARGGRSIRDGGTHRSARSRTPRDRRRRSRTVRRGRRYPLHAPFERRRSPGRGRRPARTAGRRDADATAAPSARRRETGSYWKATASSSSGSATRDARCGCSGPGTSGAPSCSPWRRCPSTSPGSMSVRMPSPSPCPPTCVRCTAPNRNTKWPEHPTAR